MISNSKLIFKHWSAGRVNFTIQRPARYSTVQTNVTQLENKTLRFQSSTSLINLSLTLWLRQLQDYFKKCVPFGIYQLANNVHEENFANTKFNWNTKRTKWVTPIIETASEMILQHESGKFLYRFRNAPDSPLTKPLRDSSPSRHPNGQRSMAWHTRWFVAWTAPGGRHYIHHNYIELSD